MLVTEAGNWKGMKRLNGMDNRYSGIDDITCTSSGAKLFKPAKPAEALALSTTLSILIYISCDGSYCHDRREEPISICN
jgi:hypothetical protein